MWCERCKRELTATEPVYRCLVMPARDFVHVCSDCASERKQWDSDWQSPYRRWQRAGRTHTWGEPKACEHCYRPVIHDSQPPEIIACSWSCRQEIYKARHRQATFTACAVCGGLFLQKRSDAIYCSPACKQKAYRESRKPK
jgi:hypothetical protein